nr:retrotransposon-related protein [Tanacetum cinerariifolium]
MASGGNDQDAKDALLKLLQMGMVVEYQSEFEILINRVTGISENLLKSFYISRLKPALQRALLRSIKKNNVFDATSSDQSTAGLEANKVVNDGNSEVLVDGIQDDAKVMDVTDEQKSDKPNVLEGNEVIGVGINENNKCVNKEVQYYVYTLHVLISFLKRFNDKYIKKKKMKAAIQRRLWDPEIKSDFKDNTLRAMWF